MSAASPHRHCGDGRACNYPRCDCAAAIGVTNTRNEKMLKRVEAGVNVLCAVGIGASAGALIVFELGGWPQVVQAVLEFLP